MLEEKKQKRLKLFSKIVSIISSIGKIGCIIGVAGLTIAMLVVPFVTSNIKVSNNVLKVFGEEIKYERTDEKIKLTYKDETHDITGKTEVFALNNVLDYLEDNNLNKVTLTAEIVFAGAFATLVIVFFMLNNLKKIAKNINRNETPFTIDNIDYLRKIGYYLIVLLILPFVISLIIQVILGVDYKISFNFSGLTIIFIAFILSYVFEYGSKLQEKSDLKIYD